MRSTVVVACASVLLLVGAAFAARERTLTVPIPGIAGPAIQFPAALRTNDGGAILLARIPSHRRAGTGTTLTARVDADGMLELGYGYEGVADLHLGPAVIPTALAINPGTGSAWIGATDGTDSEVIAIDATGQPQSGFGDDGVVKLPGADDGGVRALAWRRGEILAAAGARARCAGCALALLNANNGRLIATSTLTTELAGGSTCTEPAGVTSVAFREANGVLAGTEVTELHGCTASLLELSNRLVPLGLSAPTATPLPFQSLSSVVITPEPGATCLAGSGSAGIGIWPLGATRSTRVAASPSTRLIALVPLGAGGCGALLQSSGKHAEVTQTGAGDSAPATTRAPAALIPLGMFRCHQHLLVIAASGPAADEAAVIVPVPITRGPFAAAGAARSAPSTECS